MKDKFSHDIYICVFKTLFNDVARMLFSVPNILFKINKGPATALDVLKLTVVLITNPEGALESAS